MKLNFFQLDELLTALRFAGLRMGVREVTRCRQVVERWSEYGCEPTPERWRSLLATVLVRSKSEREILDRVFEGWLPTTTVKDGTERRSPMPVAVRRRWRFGGGYVGLGAALILALALWAFWLQPASEELLEVLSPSPVRAVETPKSTFVPFDATGARDIPGTTTNALATHPHLVILPRQKLSLPGWETLLLALGLSAWGAKVVFDLRRRSYLAREIEKPREEGPSRILLGAHQPGAPILMRAEREALIGGAVRQLTEESIPRLDLQKTVEATAKAAGFPQIRFETFRFQREIWLWLDEASEEKNLRQVADEVEQALRKEGLPCERASFRGLPDILFTADGRRFKPYDVEEQRAAVIVLILSDGQLLGRRLQGHDRASAAAVFRALRVWPRLGYFLPEGAPAAVLDLARQHQIEIKEPDELASFLAATRLQRGPEKQDLQFWRAVCALAPSSLAESTAAFLRSRLGIEVSPWQIGTLRAEAASGSERLEWHPKERCELVEWFRGIEDGSGTLYDRALDIWIEKIYRPEIENAEANPALAGTVAEWLLRAERAMLELLLRGRAAQPQRLAAVEKLDRIYEGTEVLRPWLRTKLELLDTADGSSNRLRLEFFWNELSSLHQAALIRLGLGGRKTEFRLLPPGRLVFLLALMGGFLVGLGSRALWPVAEPWPEVGAVVNLLPVNWRVTEQIRGDHRQLQLDGEDFGPELALATAARVELRSKPSVCRSQEKEDQWGFTLVRICGGSFWMGTRDDDPRAELAQATEKPAHLVTLSEFWMDKYEVSAAKYWALVPSKGGSPLSTVPVADVNWSEAASFCAARGGRLPTEAEWEYAARAGTRDPWPSGASDADLGRFAWYRTGFGTTIHKVGTKEPNRWGLHDLHGNVSEWTSTDWESYTEATRVDPPPSPSLKLPVVRGGSYYSVAERLRSALRFGDLPEVRDENLGFRCVRVSRPVLAPALSEPLSSPESDAQREPATGAGVVPLDPKQALTDGG